MQASGPDRRSVARRRAIWLAALLFASPATARTAPDVRLWRLDCGTFVAKGLVNGCYLVRHGGRYLLWDAGFGPELLAGDAERGLILRRRLTDQLAELGLQPADIAVVALSHRHWDHIGQAADFPDATLLVGADDWRALREASDPHLAPWLRDGRVDAVSGDRDVFGDGTVVMLATPGHTPGHHSLVVRLRRSGSVLLSGDLHHSATAFAAGELSRGEDPAAVRRSSERVRGLSAAGVAVVIQHDPADVDRLPRFPKAAD